MQIVSLAATMVRSIWGNYLQMDEKQNDSRRHGIHDPLAAPDETNLQISYNTDM